jgi:hypothetical protein
VRASARAALSSAIENPMSCTRIASPAAAAAWSITAPAAVMSRSVAVTWLLTS